MKTISLIIILSSILFSCCYEYESGHEPVDETIFRDPSSSREYPILYQERNWVVGTESGYNGFSVHVLLKHVYPSICYTQTHKGDFDPVVLDSMRNEAISYIKRKQNLEAKKDKMQHDLYHTAIRYTK